jgi:hypothetical protein
MENLGKTAQSTKMVRPRLYNSKVGFFGLAIATRCVVAKHSMIRSFFFVGIVYADSPQYQAGWMAKRWPL